MFQYQNGLNENWVFKIFTLNQIIFFDLFKAFRLEID